MLTPELERRIDRERQRGGYTTAVEVLSEAMDALEDRKSDFIAFRAELNAKLDESFAAVERGEVISGEELEAELDQWAAAIRA